MKSLLIIPGRFYRFSARKVISANGSPYLSSFKNISSFSADKTNFFSMRLKLNLNRITVENKCAVEYFHDKSESTYFISCCFL